jgi:hypothetical protein
VLLTSLVFFYPSVAIENGIKAGTWYLSTQKKKFCVKEFLSASNAGTIV